MFFRPRFSSALRISGWKITTTAIIATLNSLSAIQTIVFISNKTASKTKARITRIPRRSIHALVSLIQTSI